MSFSEVSGAVRPQGELDDPDAAVGQCAGNGNRVLRVVDGHHRDDRGDVQNAGGVSHG